MTNHVAAGPSGEGVWESKMLEGGETNRPLTILLLPDAANNSSKPGQSPIYYYLPQPPQIVRGDSSGTPVFTLTLLLNRQPGPTDENIYSLIEKSILNFDLTLAIPSEVTAELEREQQAVCSPLYAREATFDLVFVANSALQTISRTSATGSNAKAAISATLDREQTLGVLAALDGKTSGMNLQAHFFYRAITRMTIRLRGSWTTIYDALRADLDKTCLITRDEIRDSFFILLEKGILQGYRVSSDGSEEITDASALSELFDCFMRLSSVIFRRETPELETTGAGSTYALRARPPETMRLNYSQIISHDHQKSFNYEVGLWEILGGILDGLERSQFIHLVSLDIEEGGTLKPVPRLVRTMGRIEQRDGNGTPPSESRMKLASIGGKITSAALALKPNSAITAPSQLIIANQSAKPVIINQNLIKQWEIDDLVFEPAETTSVKSLPIVDDPSAPIWTDRLNSSKFWYAPVFSVVMPDPRAASASSPFLFSFERSGTTGTGQPALLAQVRFTLQKKMSEQARLALQAQGNSVAQAVPTAGLSISLDIPFVDESDGRLKIHRFPALYETASDSTTVTCTIELINNWVRLCYGALALPGFQNEPARLTISFSYAAYVPVRRKIFDVTIGAKEASIPIVKSSLEVQKLGNEAYFDAQKAVYQGLSGEMRFKREVLNSTKNVETNQVIVPGRGSTASTATSIAGSHLSPLRTNPLLTAAALPVKSLKPKPAIQLVVARPPFKIPDSVAETIRQTNYATQTFVREEKHVIFMPCSNLGMFYQQKLPEGNVAVGCREALSLGQTVYRLYEEIRELSTPFYQVYRFLQQPDRFLVLPANYRITRYERGEGPKAYRPCVILYSVFDPFDPARNRVILSAALQADIPFYARRELLFKLAAYSRNPVIYYPTEIESEVEYAWTIGSALMVEPNAVKTPDSFQVTLTADLSGALLVCRMIERSGLFGSVRFKLPDGSHLQTNLALELGQITGPWTGGPLEISIANGEIKLINKIERTVTVSDLIIYERPGPGIRLPVEKNLSANESHTINATILPSEAVAVYSVPAGEIAQLEEARSFVEELQTNVIFVNLINYANHGLRELEVQARLEGVIPEQTVVMNGTPPIGNLNLMMPLTSFLEKRIVQIRVRKIFDSGENALTPWFDWNLDTQGNVVSLTWDLIA